MTMQPVSNTQFTAIPSVPVAQSILKGLNVAETARFLQISPATRFFGIQAALINVQEDLKEFIEELNISDEVKKEFKVVLSNSSVYGKHKTLIDIRNAVFGFRSEMGKMVAEKFPDEDLRSLVPNFTLEAIKWRFLQGKRNNQLDQLSRQYLNRCKTNLIDLYLEFYSSISPYANYTGREQIPSQAFHDLIETNKAFNAENISKENMFSAFLLTNAKIDDNLIIDMRDEIIGKFLDVDQIEEAVTIMKPLPGGIKYRFARALAMHIYMRDLYDVQRSDPSNPVDTRSKEQKKLDYIFRIVEDLCSRDELEEVMLAVYRVVLKTKELFPLAIENIKGICHIELLEAEYYWLRLGDLDKAKKIRERLGGSVDDIEKQMEYLQSEESKLVLKFSR